MQHSSRCNTTGSGSAFCRRQQVPVLPALQPMVESDDERQRHAAAAGGEVTRPLCLALLSAFEAGGQSKAATQVRQPRQAASAGQQH